MANNAIGNTVTLEGGVQSLVKDRIVGTFRLTARAENTGNITVITPGGSYVLTPGTSSELYRNCALHEFQVSGDAGLKIVYDGGTW